MQQALMALDVVPSGRALGAEVRSADFSARISPDMASALADALAEHLVLRIRRQPISDPNLIAFGRAFGELDPPGPNPYGGPILPEFPEINVISNVIENGRPIGNLGAGEAVWHADMTYIEQPPKACILHGLEIPLGQGNTYFSNMYQAYDELPDDLKAAIEGKVAIHDASHNSAGMLRKGYEETTDVRQTPGVRHPLVRTHPRSGRRALFLGRRPLSYIVGMEVAESEALLDALWAHATQERFTFTHEWEVGDTLIWDNLSVLHRRDSFDSDARRVLHRVQIKGDEAIG